MKKHKRLYSLLVLGALLLLMSACAPVISSGGSSLSPGQVLQNSAKAMKQLKSAHFDLKAASNLLVTAATPTAATPVADQVNVNITGSGDENLPDQQSLQITIGQNITGQNISFSEIALGNKVYIKNPKGQWYVLDKSVLEGAIGNPFAGINIDPGSLLNLLQNAQLVDHGAEALNGQSLRHIAASLDKVGLKLLLTSNPQLSKLFGQQNIDNVIDHAKAFQATADLWIDETNFYVHRAELKFNLVEDLSSLNNSATPGATPTVAPLSGLTTNFDSVTDLSNFNQPVTITPPANAIPTDNLISIIG